MLKVVKRKREREKRRRKRERSTRSIRSTRNTRNIRRTERKAILSRNRKTRQVVSQSDCTGNYLIVNIHYVPTDSSYHCATVQITMMCYLVNKTRFLTSSDFVNIENLF